jgi:hypothetical protein
VIVNSYEFRVLDTVDPVTIDYAVDIVFAQDSPFIPSQQEVDALVELAFLEPNKATLLESLRSFQKSDLPFGFIDDVIFEPLLDVVVDDETISWVREEEWTSAYIGLVSGSIVVAFLVLMVLASRRRRYCVKSKLYDQGFTVVLPYQDITEDHEQDESSSGWESEVDSSLLSSETSSDTILTSSGTSTYDGS